VRNGSARNASSGFWTQSLEITISHRRTIYRIINTLIHGVITELKKGELKQQMALKTSWIIDAGGELRGKMISLQTIVAIVGLLNYITKG
jgi:hypothetical protein